MSVPRPPDNNPPPGALPPEMVEAGLDLLSAPCVCDSRYEGCEHPNPCGGANDGTERGPWCSDCNPRRIDAIRASLEALRADFRREVSQ